MGLQIALILSAVFQVIAFLITLSLIPKTKYNVAWISISIGYLLMAIRRGIEVLYFFYDQTLDAITITNSWIAVCISVTMLIGAFFIRRIFKEIDHLQHIRKANESRKLAAIISAEEKERKHFAKELHDGLGPILSAAKMTLSTLDPKTMESFNVRLTKKVASLLDNAIVTTKEISNYLTPHVLENYGLAKAMATFVRNISTQQQIDFNIEANIGRKRFANNTEVILYRICCELINNTLKYAKASRVSVLLTEDNGFLDMKYDDNGIGFCDKTNIHNGMGLINIRSRVRSLKGTVEMSGNAGRGFYAHIKLPL